MVQICEATFPPCFMAVESLAEVIELVEDELHVGVHGTERAPSSDGVGVSSDGGRIQSEAKGGE